jgi:NAD(P)-dependent dehydrogenase (short-subunit alcohol dehydrogenase family)
MNLLQGKTILVTGGTGFIGMAICKTAYTYGAKVIFTYNNNHDKAKVLADEISGHAVHMDLSNVKDIQQKVEAMYKEFPVIDILVNNAAVSQILPMAMLEEEDVDFVFDINLKGTLFVTKNVIKGMIRNKKGTIINMGSIAGTRLLDVPVTYAITKSAMSGFTYSLAMEVKKFGIRVNTVVPGMIEGGVSNGVPDDLKNDFIKHCATGRTGKGEEVAELVCFVASDKAAYINGQNITIDGGI